MPRLLTRCALGALAAALPLARPALAHDGQPVAPHDLATAWSWEPGVLVSLALAAAVYALGVRALWRRAGVGRGVRRSQAAAFAAGWLTLALALVSPLHRLGETLFAAHMVQHELLIVVAAPLLVLGRPLVPLLWALPPGWRRAVGNGARAAPARRGWQLLSHPMAAFTLHAVALWVWHLPDAYQATLRSDLAHTVQHVSFVATALLFWWGVLDRAGGARRGAAVASLFVTTLHTGVLGALLALSGTAWYPSYGAGARLWGLTVLEDQQLAGLVMWVPACIAYVIAALWLASHWLRAPAVRQSVAVAASLLLLAVVACTPDYGETTRREAVRLTGGSPERGRALMARYGCGSCHTVSGVPGARSMVGPPLVGIVERSYIAGVIENTPGNLTRWIHDPQAVDSGTAMPKVGATQEDARDMAAYIYSIR